MSSNQSLFSIGALLIFSLITLRFNTSVLENSRVEIENKVYLTAFSLADDMIEEIKQKAFDATTIDFPTTDPSTLTAPGALGHSGSEIYPNYNDIDDYNLYSKTISAPHAENYHVECTVCYVDGNNPDQQVFTQTFYKKLVVTVSSPFMNHPVILSFIFTLK
jgi:hypothetical protein